jgi:hypothetical protein
LGEIALHEHRFDQAIELAMQGQVMIIQTIKHTSSFVFV